MRRLLREPLLHFLALGALLFALYGELNRGALEAPERDRRGPRRASRAWAAQFERVWQRPPTGEELRGPGRGASCARRCSTARGSRSASTATTR